MRRNQFVTAELVVHASCVSISLQHWLYINFIIKIDTIVFVDTPCLLVETCVITLQKICLNRIILSRVTQSLHWCRTTTLSVWLPIITAKSSKSQVMLTQHKESVESCTGVCLVGKQTRLIRLFTDRVLHHYWIAHFPVNFKVGWVRAKS